MERASGDLARIWYPFLVEAKGSHQELASKVAKFIFYLKQEVGATQFTTRQVGEDKNCLREPDVFEGPNAG